MELVAIISLDYDICHLSHFLSHYRQVDTMSFILHANNPCTPIFNDIEHRIKEVNPKCIIDRWVGEFSDYEKTKRQEALRNPDEWVLFPDIDELYDFGTHPKNLLDYKAIEHPDGSSWLLYGCLQDWMADRTRTPKHLEPNPSIEIQYPYPCPMGCTSPGKEYKVVMTKGKFKYRHPHQGFMGMDQYRKQGGGFVKIDHYRWTTQRIAKLQERVNWSRGRLRSEAVDEIELYCGRQ